MIVRVVGPEDRAEWLRMRRALWGNCSDDQQVRETAEILGRSSGAVKQLQLRGVRNLAKVLPREVDR